MKNSVYDIFEDVSETKFPGFKKAIWLECIQERNEIIFVPSGWYHQVHNEEDTISINHNWFNAYNLSWVWDLLIQDHNVAKEYIEDIRDICDDFEGLCQRNLAANTGMNFYDFSIFLARFSFANLVKLFHLVMDNGHFFWSSSPIAQHLALNLVSTRRIAVKMSSVSFLANHCGLLLDFRDTLNDPKFLQLCTVFGGTYEMIHKWQSSTLDMKNALTNEFGILAFTEDFGSQLCGLVDLIKLIDHAFTKFGGNSSENDFFAVWTD